DVSTCEGVGGGGRAGDVDAVVAGVVPVAPWLRHGRRRCPGPAARGAGARLPRGRRVGDRRRGLVCRRGGGGGDHGRGWGGGVGCAGGVGGGDEGGDGGADVSTCEGVGGGGRAGDGDAVVAGVVAVAPLLGDGRCRCPGPGSRVEGERLPDRRGAGDRGRGLVCRRRGDGRDGASAEVVDRAGLELDREASGVRVAGGVVAGVVREHLRPV